MSLWRNRLARSAVNRKVGGSSPPRDEEVFWAISNFILKYPTECKENSPKSDRNRQDSNLRGETPMDFESIALTTRPRLQLWQNWLNLVSHMSEEIISLFGHVIICEYPKALSEPSDSFKVESGNFLIRIDEA